MDRTTKIINDAINKERLIMSELISFFNEEVVPQLKKHPDILDVRPANNPVSFDMESRKLGILRINVFMDCIYSMKKQAMYYGYISWLEAKGFIKPGTLPNPPYSLK